MSRFVSYLNSFKVAQNLLARQVVKRESNIDSLGLVLTRKVNIELFVLLFFEFLITHYYV